MRDLSHLRYRGWKQKEIAHAHKILHRAEKSKHPHLKTLEVISFWLNLSIIAIASFMFAALSTYMVYLTEYLGYGVTAIVALVVGTLFVSTFEHLDDMRTHHHILTVVIIFITAMISYLISSSLTDIFLSQLIIQSRTYSPVALALCYTCFFLLPYGYHAWHDNYIKRKATHPHHGA